MQVQRLRAVVIDRLVRLLLVGLLRLYAIGLVHVLPFYLVVQGLIALFRTVVGTSTLNRSYQNVRWFRSLR